MEVWVGRWWYWVGVVVVVVAVVWILGVGVVVDGWGSGVGGGGGGVSGGCGLRNSRASGLIFAHYGFYAWLSPNKPKPRTDLIAV